MPATPRSSADSTCPRPRAGRSVAPTRRLLGRRARAAVGPLLLVVAGCVGGLSPQSELDAAQSMLELHDVLAAIREEQAMMQEELDSLHRLVARQDTLLRRVAEVTGVPVRR